MKAYIQQRINRWLDRNIPAQDRVSLDRGKVFIFPSAGGFGYLALLLLLWLLGTNYENNLIFLFTYLLTGVFLVAMLQSFANLGGLQVSFSHANPAYAGEMVALQLVIAQRGRRYRDAISLRFPGQPEEMVSLSGEQTHCTLLAQSTHRGWLRPGRVTLESRFPLGLFRVWTHLDLNCKALLYPRPVSGDVLSRRASGTGQGPLQDGEGSEDFVGLRRYQPGESRQRIAWKQYAREQGLHSKHFADSQEQRLWLDWEDYQGLDREARLSRLCSRLLQLSRTPDCYGLRLPGVEIPPAQGESHRNRLLRELAQFELPEAWQ